MRKLARYGIFWLVLFIIRPVFADPGVSSPIGYWKTIDDVTGKARSIVHIYVINNTLSGQVVKIFPRPGYSPNRVCKACKGFNHNKPIVGLVILEGLKQDPLNSLQWSGGTILDPNNGKLYHCKLTLAKSGNTLNLRGYVGVTMFGRSQNWIRINESHLILE